MSSRTKVRLPRSALTSAEAGASPGCSVTPRARATVGSRSAGSRSGARGIQDAPSGKHVGGFAAAAWMRQPGLAGPTRAGAGEHRASGSVSSAVTTCATSVAADERGGRDGEGAPVERLERWDCARSVQERLVRGIGLDRSLRR